MNDGNRRKLCLSTDTYWNARRLHSNPINLITFLAKPKELGTEAYVQDNSNSEK